MVVDCLEERLIYEAEEMECSFCQVPSVLELGMVDAPWGSKEPAAKARRALLRHTVEMYNVWLAASMDGSRIVTSDLSRWAQEDDLRTIIWFAALNRDGRMRDHFPTARSATPRFTSLHAYREIAHSRALKQHRLTG